VTTPKSILAILVLYRMSADRSPAFLSLGDLLARKREASEAVELMLFDNSPQKQSPPSGFSGLYVSDTSNPGLAAAYNRALAVAAEAGIPWLLLLDQDTGLNEAYIDEVLALVRESGPSGRVVAFVPKLADRSIVCSPIVPPGLGPARAVSLERSGVAEERLHVFNSGAVVSVAALQGIGGFPADFPVDYLDHATFTQLQTAGGKLHVMHATIAHELSSNEEAAPGSAGAARQAQVLDAERRFYAQYGTAGDRLSRRLRLLRAVAGRLLRRKERGQTWRMLRAALRP